MLNGLAHEADGAPSSAQKKLAGTLAENPIDVSEIDVMATLGWKTGEYAKSSRSIGALLSVMLPVMVISTRSMRAWRVGSMRITGVQPVGAGDRRTASIRPSTHPIGPPHAEMSSGRPPPAGARTKNSTIDAAAGRWIVYGPQSA